MPSRTVHIGAAPEEVWAILSDPTAYGHFVVGSRQIRDFDPEWPRPGASLHHKVGFGPLTVRDSSTVLESVPPRRLVLEARFRPFGDARVEFSLLHAGTGSEVILEEHLTGGAWDLPGVRDFVGFGLKVRNRELLRRLRRLAERRARESRRARLVASRTAG